MWDLLLVHLHIYFTKSSFSLETSSFFSLSPSQLLFPDIAKCVFFIPCSFSNLTLILLRKTFFHPSPHSFFSLLPISLFLFVNLISSPNPLSIIPPVSQSLVYPLCAAATTACSLWLHLFLFIPPSVCRFIPLILSSLSVFLCPLAPSSLTLPFHFILLQFSEVRGTSSFILLMSVPSLTELSLCISFSSLSCLRAINIKKILNILSIY